jgi:hypothetical protein
VGGTDAAHATALAGGASGTPVSGGVVRRRVSGVALATSGGMPRRRGSFGGPAAASRVAEFVGSPPSAESGLSAGGDDTSAASGSALSRLSSLFSRKESAGYMARPAAGARPQEQAQAKAQPRDAEEVGEEGEEEEDGEKGEEEAEALLDNSGAEDEGGFDDGDNGNGRAPAPLARRGFGQLG